MRTSASILASLALALPLLLSTQASAMSEELFNTHNNGIILHSIMQSEGKLELLKAQIPSTGISVLDDLWRARRDIVDGICDSTQNTCRVVSVFPGKVTDHPVVLLPGFTGYRKLYLEEIYDLIQAGYGPIYISDFTGTGDSYKPELVAGQSLPSLDEFAAKLKPDIEPELQRKIINVVGAANLLQVRQTIGKLPIGLGYIPKFSTYISDVNLIMTTAVKENPDNKIFIASLSMSGLCLVLALADQEKHPSWISHVDRIVLESPMLRVKTADSILPGFGMLSDIFAKIGGGVFGATAVVQPRSAVLNYVDRALGNFNPKNTVSTSVNRVTFNDAIRLWDGHDTAGGTFGWGYEELTHQYAIDPFDSLPLFVHPLNQREGQIVKVLKENNISLVAVVSLADPLVDPAATQAFMRDLTEAGAEQNSLCLYQTSKHQIDIEADKYREPFIALLADQKNHLVKATYGEEPRNELLQCTSLRKLPPPPPAAEGTDTSISN